MDRGLPYLLSSKTFLIWPAINAHSFHRQKIVNELKKKLKKIKEIEKTLSVKPKTNNQKQRFV